MAVALIEAFRLSARREPGRPSVIEVEAGRSRSRGEILNAALRLAEWLDREVPGHATVLLHGPGGAGYWAGLIAVLGSGRRLLPVGPDVTDADRASLVNSHRVAAVVETDPTSCWSSPPEGLPRSVVDLDTTPGDGGPDTLDRGGRSSLLLRSSGTTGRPGVVLREAPAIDRIASTLVQVLELGEDDRVLATIPMQHAYGIEHGVFAPMLAGASVAFKAGFDLMAGAGALLEGTTVFPAVPVTLEAAARVGRRGTDLRLAYTAGTRLPSGVREAFKAAWDVPVGDLYGMSEIGTITWGVDDDGSPVPGVSIGVIDPEDPSATPRMRREGVGEIVVRSDAMFKGYLDRCDVEPDPGRRVDGHLRTGDLGEIDASGRVRITGRAKLQFDVGGLKVNPEDVERALGGTPGVREVAVVPLDLTETVTRVMAVVVPEDDRDRTGLETAVRDEARRLLPAHQRPRVIRFVSELPRSATGKMLRGRLQEAADLNEAVERSR